MNAEHEPAALRRARLVVAYDGSGYHGFAETPDRKTVMGVLRAAIERVVGQPVDLVGAGRTDAGVHAWGQVVSGDLPAHVDLHGLVHRVNRMCGPSVVVRDASWALPDADKQRVLGALTYFCDPQDVIPDHVEVLGFLDDAVMIELSVRELKHELDAYDDFCDFRDHEARRRGADASSLGRTDWLDSRREELVERMHSRRERDFGVGYGRSSGYGRTSYVRAWRPGVFTVR